MRTGWRGDDDSIEAGVRQQSIDIRIGGGTADARRKCIADFAPRIRDSDQPRRLDLMCRVQRVDLPHATETNHAKIDFCVQNNILKVR